jgi:hypothetical protein
VSDQPKYWFNIKTKQVEKGLKSSSLDRIGPFETESEAKAAEEIVRQRAQAWSKEEAEED